MPQDILQNPVRDPMQENPGIEKISDQAPTTMEAVPEVQQAMEVLDLAMSEISESQDLSSTVEGIISKLQAFVKQKKSEGTPEVESNRVFTRNDLTDY